MKKGFTLIELLAVIVILAIIALIATPITLNIIENVRSNAAKQSANGYIDAVKNQIVLNMMDNNSLSDGTYTVSQLSSKGVIVNGTNPTEGWVKIENGQITEYSLKIDDYAVNYNKTNNQTTVEKNGNTNNEQVNLPTLDEMCPGCVFAYPTDSWYFEGENQTTLTPNQYKTNYQDVVAETGKNYFLGAKLNSSNQIVKVYACTIQNNNPLCLEGSKDGSTYEANTNILKAFYNKGYIDLGEFTEEDEENAFAIMINILYENGYINSIDEITSMDDFLEKANGICMESTIKDISHGISCFGETDVSTGYDLNYHDNIGVVSASITSLVSSEHCEAIETFSGFSRCWNSD